MVVCILLATHDCNGVKIPKPSDLLFLSKFASFSGFKGFHWRGVWGGGSRWGSNYLSNTRDQGSSINVHLDVNRKKNTEFSYFISSQNAICLDLMIYRRRLAPWPPERTGPPRLPGADGLARGCRSEPARGCPQPDMAAAEQIEIVFPVHFNWPVTSRLCNTETPL